MENTTAQNEGQSKKTKIINTVVNVILVVAILFGALCAYTAYVSRNETDVPSIFGVCIYVIESDSMSPTFDKGDVIIGVKVKDYSKLKANSAEDVKDGDIITFRTVIGGQVVLNTHRIVKIYTPEETTSYYEFVTRGDNDNITGNDEFHPREVISKYLFRIAGFGTFINFLQSETGFGFVILLPVALFFIWQLVQFFRSLFAYQAEKTKLALMEQMGLLKQEAEKAKLESEQPKDQSTDPATPKEEPTKTDNNE